MIISMYRKVKNSEVLCDRLELLYRESTSDPVRMGLKVHQTDLRTQLTDLKQLHASYGRSVVAADVAKRCSVLSSLSVRNSSINDCSHAHGRWKRRHLGQYATWRDYRFSRPLFGLQSPVERLRWSGSDRAYSVNRSKPRSWLETVSSTYSFTIKYELWMVLFV
jgi:hypothetical protein